MYLSVNGACSSPDASPPLGSQFFFISFASFPTYIPAISSLWKWSIALNTSLLKWSRCLSKNHTDSLCYFMSSNSLVMIKNPIFPHTNHLKTCSTSHLSFEHFCYFLANIVVFSLTSVHWERDDIGYYPGSPRIAESASWGTYIVLFSDSWYFLYSHLPGLPCSFIWVPSWDRKERGRSQPLKEWCKC